MLADRVEVRSLDRHIADQDQLVETVAHCEILVITRERTPFAVEDVAAHRAGSPVRVITP